MYILHMTHNTDEVSQVTPNSDHSNSREMLGVMRNDLSMYRCALLSKLENLCVDRFPLDLDRVAVVKVICSTKQITQQRVMTAIESTLCKLHGVNVYIIRLFAVLKAHLLDTVDASTNIADVVNASSKDATRVPRDGPKPRVADGSTVTRDVQELADLIWQLKGTKSTLAQDIKAKKRQRPQAKKDATGKDKQVISSTPGPGVDMCAPIPTNDHSALEDAQVTVEATPQTAMEVKLMTPNKPRSSLSKSLAYNLLGHVAELLVQHEAVVPSWGDVSTAVADLVNQYYMDPTAFGKALSTE